MNTDNCNYRELLNSLSSSLYNTRRKALDEVLSNLNLSIPDSSWLKRSFLFDPASTKYHGNFEGGLISHSANVALTLMDYQDRGICKFREKRSPIIVGLFHDLCKAGTYVGEYNEKTHSWVYNKSNNDIWQGHATKTLGLICSGAVEGLILNEEEALCIRYHMGAYEKDDWNGFGKAIEKYSTVLYTHTADMYATHSLSV